MVKAVLEKNTQLIAHEWGLESLVDLCERMGVASCNEKLEIGSVQRYGVCGGVGLYRHPNFLEEGLHGWGVCAKITVASARLTYVPSTPIT
jgi:hypothetical protein